jgi:hypothetical protein
VPLEEYLLRPISQKTSEKARQIVLAATANRRNSKERVFNSDWAGT